MARPVQANAAETRRRLVHSAVDQFSRCGFEATSLRKVAQEAEVSLATIHYYFRSKAGLYEACMESLRGSLATGFAPLQEMFALLEESQALDPALAAKALKTTEDQLARLALRILLNQTSQERSE